MKRDFVGEFFSPNSTDETTEQCIFETLLGLGKEKPSRNFKCQVKLSDNDFEVICQVIFLLKNMKLTSINSCIFTFNIEIFCVKLFSIRKLSF